VPSLPFLDSGISVAGPSQPNIVQASPGQAEIPFVGANVVAGSNILSEHISATMGIHGISNTANLEYLTNKNAANGYAGLGADGKISLSLLPDANALESEAIAFAIALG